MPLVIDASVTLAWCFADEATPYTVAIRDQLSTTTAAVPVIWPLEVANVLLIGERRGRLTAAQAVQFLDLLGDLPITVESDTGLRAWNSIFATARATGLTAYDASYLELAMRRGWPLATNDQRLRTAAREAGVNVLE